ncbi:MAG TPA: hypothetical protein DCM87_17355 [Planctomycetes bacterium]|nr:hypothetical protein [Planctomycetota bacterium]
MSGLAKVFLVINLVLALLFLGTSATLFGVRKDFKEQSEELTKLYKGNFDKQKEDIEKLAEKVQLYATVMSVQNADIVNSDTLKKDLARKLSDAESKLAAATTDNTTKQASLDKLTAQLAQVSQETQALASRVRQSEDARTKAVADRTDAVADRNRQFLDYVSLKDNLMALEKEISDLRDENDSLRTRIKVWVNEGMDVGTPFPDIAAKVLTVQGKRLVILSVGSDDKVVEGMVFIVHRDGKYLGDVKIVNVYTDMSGAEVVHVVNGAEIKEGDDAKTKQLL